MKWEEKFQAMNALTEVVLKMRKPGDWYVSAIGRSIAGDGFLRSEYGNGTTPQEAIDDDWGKLVVFLPSDRYISTSKGNFVWNGFMWERRSV